MIDVFHADQILQIRMQQADDERQLIRMVIDSLGHYALASRVKHHELDIAFMVTGGPSVWVNQANMNVAYTPVPARQSHYGDILVEHAGGYVSLSTPMGFIPLIDVIEQQGRLQVKIYN